MADSERLVRLRGIELFAGLDDDALSRLAAIGTETDVPAGSVVIERDQPGSGMFVIEDGRVLVELPGQTIALGPGEFIGELSLLIDGAHRAARVRAEGPARLFAIGRADFLALLDDEPRIAIKMLPVLARRLHALIEPH